MVLLFKKDGVDDLVMISSLSNDSVAGELQARLKRNLIYTNIGQVLISVNPFKRLPIYGEDQIKLYATSTTVDTPPHIYQLAETAYRSMCGDRQSQSVIISGESGSGKTECAKLLLAYISAVSGGTDQAEAMKSLIQSTNPLLESFGNAKTIRNDNSSRFGKYLELSFSDQGEPVSGRTLKFLLEKSRVSMQAKGERNFHIFYQLVKGANDEMKEHFGISGDPQQFAYLGQTQDVDGIDDASMFQEVFNAMDIIGVESDNAWYCFQLLAGILHLGNIVFEGEEKCQVANTDELEWAAHLFQMDPKVLEKAITNKLIYSGRGSIIEVSQNADQASGLRDAMAKALYERLFTWLVDSLNSAMNGSKKTNISMGVLDIYGFEIFEENGYEQFCINYVNEKLQQIFIDLTLRQEQQEYHDEGMKWKDIKFFDNKIVCDLIEGKQPPGIFRLLDDVCKSVHAVDSITADTKFITKLQKGIPVHPHLEYGEQMFTIKHYAGDVAYQVVDFCFKNKDDLVVSLIARIQTSENPLVLSIFSENVKGQKRTPPTTGRKIRESCGQLIKKLVNCAPHYIRCIKSNDKKAALTFNKSRVKFQVKYLGLVENIRVKKAGFSYRNYYQHFVERYWQLPDVEPTTADKDGAKIICDWVCEQKLEHAITKDEFAYGNTKIFVKQPETIFIMGELLEKKLNPEQYAEKVKAFKDAEKATRKAQDRGVVRKCIIM